ncbi:MAG TPA: YjbQ family protein [Anaerolineae bacterium]|nr:YjbQ family protein [Anaerolineae bacterium]HIQ04608.1 YjbQ family protein [Anaerolineae bacterium]
MLTLDVSSRHRTELVDITDRVREAVSQSGVTEGICYLFVPHTTAGLTLNENWDPSVGYDLLMKLDELVPQDPHYRHTEGNSPAHIKTSLCGSSAAIFIDKGRLRLGRWQGIYLAEFDGPRHRQVWLKIIPG